MLTLTAVVEGDTDEPALRKTCALAGWQLGTVIDCRGKHRLDERLPRYLAAARHSPWLVLRDLDSDAFCAAALVQKLAPGGAGRLCLRVAVRAIESWALADDEQIEAFFKVPKGQIPVRPDTLTDPKATLVNLARRSTSRLIRTGMAPTGSASRRQVGSAYEALLIDFFTNRWRADFACRRSPSLARAVKALRDFKEAWRR